MRIPARPPSSALAEVWDGVFARADPWCYDDLYERSKRAHVLEMLPTTPVSRALELGCAEGHFTVDLAQAVTALHAVDISAVALAREAARCRQLGNVSFERCDIFRALPEGRFDLIVCSEVLYYAQDRLSLDRLSRRLVSRLRQGGYVVLAHSNAVADDRRATGFDFHEIGAQFIGKRFERLPELELTRELRTDLYRVQLFKRVSRPAKRRRLPDVIPGGAQFRAGDRAVGLVKWGGCEVTDAEARHLWRSPEIAVLAYHRIADRGAADLAPYRVNVESFRLQLSYLRRQGYQSIGLKEAVECLADVRRPPRGRLVVFTFDDAYKDFYQCAWPVLREHGFGATLFVPVGWVGLRAEWDRSYGDPAELMSWDEIRDARRQGVTIGSHAVTHARLVGLSRPDLDQELRGSREALEAELGAPQDLLSYPFNSADDSVSRAALVCGYRHAVLGAGLLRPGADPHRLPRQEVLGHYTMDQFAHLLGTNSRSPLSTRLHYRWRRMMRDRRTYTNF